MTRANLEGQLAIVQNLMGRHQAENAKSLIDVKGIAKPEKFHPKKDGEDFWHEFAFKLETFVTTVYPEVEEMMEWCLESDDEITCMSTELKYDDDGKAIAKQLHSLLASITGGEAMTIVKNSGAGNGLGSWRALNRRFDPKTYGRKRAALQLIMNPGEAKLEQLHHSIENLKELITRYENRSGKVLDDDIKFTSLQSMCPKDLRSHIEMNVSRIKTFSELKSEIVAYLEARDLVAPGHGAGTQNTGVVPMDVGSLGALGKGSKGKGGKGGKGGKCGKGKGKGKESKEKIQCYKCGKWGSHYAKDCRGGSAGPGKGNSGQGGGKGGKNGGKGKNYQPYNGYCGSCGNWGHSSANCWSKGKGKGARSLSAEESAQQQPAQPAPPGLGGLALSSVSAIDEVKKTTTQEKMLRMINSLPQYALDPSEMYHDVYTIDSGAAISALPRNRYPDYEVDAGPDSSYGTKYLAANGETVKDEGIKVPIIQTEAGLVRGLQFSVYNVHKPLVSLAKIRETGNRIVFDDECYIQNKETMEKVYIYEKNGTFHLPVKVFPRHAMSHKEQMLAPMGSAAAPEYSEPASVRAMASASSSSGAQASQGGQRPVLPWP